MSQTLDDFKVTDIIDPQQEAKISQGILELKELRRQRRKQRQLKKLAQLSEVMESQRVKGSAVEDKTKAMEMIEKFFNEIKTVGSQSEDGLSRASDDSLM